MRKPAIIEPVRPDGKVVQGDIDEVLRLESKGKNVIPNGMIELHQHSDGRWMWSTSYHLESESSTYRVGEKWGQFASSRDDALFWAIAELRSNMKKRESRLSRRVLRWLEELQGELETVLLEEPIVAVASNGQMLWNWE